MELSIFMNIPYRVALLRHIPACRGDQFQPLGPVREHGRCRPVAEQGVRDDEADIVVHLKGSAAYLDGSAPYKTVSIFPEQRLSHLEIRDRAAAAAAYEVVCPYCAGEPQFFQEVRRDAGTDVAGAGIHHQACHITYVRPRLRHRFLNGLGGEFDGPMHEPRDVCIRIFVHEGLDTLDGKVPLFDARMGKNCIAERQAPGVQSVRVMIPHELFSRRLVGDVGRRDDRK